MRQFIATILILTGAMAYAQNYTSLIAEASAFYNDKQYSQSVEKYKMAFKINQDIGSDFYNAGCSASQMGDYTLAFDWLNMALKKGWSNLPHLKIDTDLVPLHGDAKWDKLISDVESAVAEKEAKYDKPLKEKLLSILKDDQQVRTEYLAAQKDFGRESKQVDSLAKIARYKDSINLLKVAEILDEHGWVGADKVGPEANQTLFLVIQHADLKTQQKYLPMMKEAVETGNASSSTLALLEDRVALREGKRQIYGSQIGFDKKTNKSYVLPLDDPDNVDKRRAEVGLGPLADYVKRWEIDWNVEEYKRNLDKIENIE